MFNECFLSSEPLHQYWREGVTDAQMLVELWTVPLNTLILSYTSMFTVYIVYVVEANSANGWFLVLSPFYFHEWVCKKYLEQLFFGGVKFHKWSTSTKFMEFAYLEKLTMWYYIEGSFGGENSILWKVGMVLFK